MAHEVARVVADWVTETSIEALMSQADSIYSKSISASIPKHEILHG